MTLTPYAALGLSLLAVVVTTILAVVLSPRRKGVVDYGRDDSLDDVQPTRRAFVPPTVHPTITLTPRQIERINIQRKLRGKPPFNRRGLSNAVAHPWDRYDVRQPQNTADWISYLIAYEILFDNHSTSTVTGCQGINIDPNLPYNGQGGEYAGAGASGSWGDSLTRAEAAAVEHGVPIVGGPYVGEGPGAAVAPSDDRYQPGDTVHGYSGAASTDPYATVAAEVRSDYSAPTPSYSAPDPAPSIPDSSPSFSSDGGGGGGGGE